MVSQKTYTAKIPVTFYPPGNLGHIDTDVEGVFELPTSEIALVLVDTWNSGDPEAGREPSQYLKDIQSCLHQCRTHGITVIHAPNHPVVDKYPQYHAIQKTVQNYLKDYPLETNAPPFLDWPPRDNDIRTQASKVRIDALAGEYTVTHRVKERDILKFAL